MNILSETYEKFVKYSEYYDLCNEGREFLRESAEKICEDENLVSEALKFKSRLADWFDNFKADDEFKGKTPQFCAFVFTLAIEDMERLYKEKNISRDIFIDTVSDLAVWINRHHAWFGEWGFSQYGWLIHHLRGKIFKLGRLQFEPATAEFGELDSPPAELKLGDPFLSVHIPRGGKLDEAACLESFERAKEFFPKVLNYDFKVFGCFSWLFDPAFENLLTADSNIVKFQKLFAVGRYWESYDGLNYVFVNITKENIKDAPTDTTFRKKLAGYVSLGGIMQSGAGYRLV